MRLTCLALIGALFLAGCGGPAEKRDFEPTVTPALPIAYACPNSPVLLDEPCRYELSTITSSFGEPFIALGLGDPSRVVVAAQARELHGREPLGTYVGGDQNKPLLELQAKDDFGAIEFTSTEGWMAWRDNDSLWVTRILPRASLNT